MTDRGPRARVLVLEDHDGARDTLLRIVERGGYEGRGAKTIAEARRACSTWKPAVLLLDRHVDDGDALELARSLRAGTRHRPRPHIVVMSGVPPDDADREVVDEYLLKPATARQLLDLLARFAT